jgi:hypothetical protein
MPKEDKNKKQAIDKAYTETLEKINKIKARVESNNAAVKISSKEQEQIDDILAKIKKDL